VRGARVLAAPLVGLASIRQPGPAGGRQPRHLPPL